MDEEILEVQETAVESGAVQEPDENGEELWQQLEAARSRVEQLERERFLLLQGVPEEDLDYCVFRIGTLVTEKKDFAAAARDFLSRQKAGGERTGFRTGASLTGGLGGQRDAGKTPNDVMNSLIRGRG